MLYTPDPRLDFIVSKICPYVKNKTQITFWYEDETDSSKADWRNVEPHLIGIHKTSKNYNLSAWFNATPLQKIQGYESGWHNYLIERIDLTKLKSLDIGYKHTRRYYNSKDSRMSYIFCATTEFPDPARLV